MTPSDETDDGLEELAKTNPTIREFLDLLAELDACPDADPNPPPMTFEEKMAIIAEWEKAPHDLR